MPKEKKEQLYDLFLRIIGSENLDYIEEQLRQIYNEMVDYITNMEIHYIDISTGKEIK